MKQYKVVLTPEAEDDLWRYLKYLQQDKMNPQAAANVLDDFEKTKMSLSDVAGSLREPDSEKLKKRGLKRINFIDHNYFMLYCIVNGDVYITNIFHGLENYENKLR